MTLDPHSSNPAMRKSVALGKVRAQLASSKPADLPPCTSCTSRPPQLHDGVLTIPRLAPPTVSREGMICPRDKLVAMTSLLFDHLEGSCQTVWLKARSWGASTPMKMCIQADLDTTGALRHMNKNNSARPVCRTRTSPPLPTFFVSPKRGTVSTPEREGRAQHGDGKL